MARNSVDLPAPLGPDQQRRLLRHEHDIADAGELAAVRQVQFEIGNGERLADGRARLDARRRAPGRLCASESFVERSQTADRRAEIGKADVTVDEEIHLRVDVAERVRRLIERAERYLLGEVERRDDHIGNDTEICE